MRFKARSSQISTRGRIVPALLAIAAIAVPLAGCGGSSPSDSKTGSSQPAASTAATTTTAAARPDSHTSTSGQPTGTTAKDGKSGSAKKQHVAIHLGDVKLKSKIKVKPKLNLRNKVQVKKLHLKLKNLHLKVKLGKLHLPSTGATNP